MFNRHRVISIIILFFVGCLSTTIMANSHTDANDEGKNLAAQILNNNLKPSTSSASVTQLMQGLGVDSHTVGGPSSDQVADMGIAGSTFATFHFMVKPACESGTQHLPGLEGTTITMACQAGGSAVRVEVCIASSLQKKCTPQMLQLPLTGKAFSALGFSWQASCDGHGLCQGKMAQNVSISANSDTLVQTGVSSQKNNAAYQSIYNTYASKSGYNRTQAYMKSFGDSGSNNWLSKCTAGMPGYIDNGQYYSCSQTQQGDMNNDCKPIKTCTEYKRHEKTTTTPVTCTIHAIDKSLLCKRWAEATVVNAPYVKPVPNPCDHIVILTNSQTPTKGAQKIGSFQINRGWMHSVIYTVYSEAGENNAQGCYIPGSVHIEHDRDQHGTSRFQSYPGATYVFHAEAFYVQNAGYADLFIQTDDGKTVGRLQASSNQGEKRVAYLNLTSAHITLNGYNHGFPDSYYFGAWSVYWASTPVKQTHKVANVTWKEDCGVSQ